jgi:hypothetical protein
MVVINRHGTSLGVNGKMLLYYTNVTAGGSPQLMIDSSTGFTGKIIDTNTLTADLYRQGTCSGWQGISHLTAA